MAKSNKRRTMKRHSRKHRMRGGYSDNMNVAGTAADFSSGPNAEGANTWVEGKYGTMNQQYSNVFDIGSKTLGNSFTTLPASQQPTPQSVAAAQNMTGGKRRRSRRRMSRKKRRMSRKHKKGGMFTGVAQTALVPFGLLALHNRYGKKAKRGKKSRKLRK